MTDRLIFYALVFVLLLIFGIDSAVKFFKKRSKRDLVTLIIITMALTVTAFSFLFQWGTNTMNFDRLLYLLLLASLLVLITSTFLRWRGYKFATIIKYNSATLIAAIISLFILVFPRTIKSILNSVSDSRYLQDTILYSILVIIMILLFYSEIKGFLSRRVRMLHSIDAESDPDKKEIKFQNALRQFPQNPELLYNYARFLSDIHKDYDKAEEYYHKVIEADLKPASARASILGAYARFLKDIRKDYDKAEEFYNKALALDPKNVFSLGDYAYFLW